MKAAIYLRNNTLCKTNNIEKKLKKESQPIKILEEWEFDNNMSKLDERYNYWNKVINPEVEKNENEIKLYYFKNPKTGYTITSIYPTLDESYIKDYKDYERITNIHIK